MSHVIGGTNFWDILHMLFVSLKLCHMVSILMLIKIWIKLFHPASRVSALWILKVSVQHLRNKVDLLTLILPEHYFTKWF